ncbi:MAG: hypothetical protein Q9159_000194 [Coniocarpon cinnabarinum]
MGIPQHPDATPSSTENTKNPQPASDQSSGQPKPSSNAQSTSQLPPEALDLAAKLFDAARSGNTDLLAQYLSAGIPPNLTNSSGDTLLMLAAYYGHASTVQLLVRQGADVNGINGKGQSPLAGAVFKDYTEVVRVLVEAGADKEAGQPNAVECAGMFKREDIAKIMDVDLEEGGGQGGVEGARDAMMRRMAMRYASRVDEDWQ